MPALIKLLSASQTREKHCKANLFLLPFCCMLHTSVNCRQPDWEEPFLLNAIIPALLLDHQRYERWLRHQGGETPVKKPSEKNVWNMFESRETKKKKQLVCVLGCGAQLTPLAEFQNLIDSHGRCQQATKSLPPVCTNDRLNLNTCDYVTPPKKNTMSFEWISPASVPQLRFLAKRMVFGVDSSISMSRMMLWWCSMTLQNWAPPCSWKNIGNNIGSLGKTWKNFGNWVQPLDFQIIVAKKTQKISEGKKSECQSRMMAISS